MYPTASRPPAGPSLFEGCCCVRVSVLYNNAVANSLTHLARGLRNRRCHPTSLVHPHIPTTHDLIAKQRYSWPPSTLRPPRHSCQRGSWLHVQQRFRSKLSLVGPGVLDLRASFDLGFPPMMRFATLAPRRTAEKSRAQSVHGVWRVLNERGRTRYRNMHIQTFKHSNTFECGSTTDQ